MIKVIRYHLMIYALLDFMIQTFFQMPMVSIDKIFGIFTLEQIGIRLVWQKEQEDGQPLDYDNFISHTCNTDLNNFNGQQLNLKNFYLQCINCVMICVLSLQTEIFASFGYDKFVTKKDGMELFVSLAEIKSKSIAYCINNAKLQKIFSIQAKKEQVDETVNQLKEKLIRWRKFTRTTLNDEKTQNPSDEEEAVSPTKLAIDSADRALERSKSAILKKFENGVRSSYSQKKLKVVGFMHEENKVQIEKREPKMNEQETDQFIQLLSKEFVKEKLSKLNMLSRWYLWLNKSFVELIMFKNEKDTIEELFESHSKGQVDTPTELETILEEDAQFQIRKLYDHNEGAKKLYKIKNQYQSRTSSRGGNASKDMLEKTGLLTRIKLKQLTRVWAFTRKSAMAHHLFETLCYIMISNTQNFIYLSMIGSMYMNAGLISLPYPIMVFGYAMLEETRPRKEFWEIVRVYTICILFFKFVGNLSILEPFFGSDAFIKFQALVNLGLYDYSDLTDMVMYMLPEIMIICFIMLNEIYLNLVGLHYQTEQDIENVIDGQQRLIANGDQQEVQRHKVFSANMAMVTKFYPKKLQQKIEDEDIKQLLIDKQNEYNQDKTLDINTDPISKEDIQKHKQEMNDEIDQTLKNLKKMDSAIGRRRNNLMSSISKDLWKSSRQFDIDLSANNKFSPFDTMIKENCLQKNLDSDDLIIVEGRQAKFFEYTTIEQIKDDNLEANKLESMSAADFEEEYNEKFDFIEEKEAPVLTRFEKSPYFLRLFPSLKIQKPGNDFYGSSTCFLAALAIYVFLYYSRISVDPATLIDSVKASNNIFMGEMALCLIAVISLIIVERYINRSDTKKVTSRGVDFMEKESKTILKKDQMFKRASTQRSMTISLKTMKTSDVNMEDDSVKDFFKQIQNETTGVNDSEEKTKITTQQKCKFYLHWIILIFVHIFVFWYIPISGNLTLYETPECPPGEASQLYGCKSFHKNPYLRLFYFFFVMYLLLSALQIKHGMPTQRIASSVAQYYNDPAYFGCMAYMAIPFAIEIRCVLDFTFSKTSLDVFQFWQLFTYHLELYCAKMGNIYYVSKTLGSRIEIFDKILFGVVFMVIYLGLLISPILFFSDYGGFITENPIKEADLKISFLIHQNISEHDLDPRNVLDKFQDFTAQENITHYAEEIESNTQYLIYESQYPFLRDYDDDFYKQQGFGEKTETKSFGPALFQDMIASQYSDESWGLSQGKKEQWISEMSKTFDGNDQTASDAKFNLAIDYQFERNLPKENKTTKGTQVRTLDLNFYYDCQTALDIQAMLKLAIKCQNEPSYRKLEGGAYREQSVRFYQAFYPTVVLGANQNSTELIMNMKGLDDAAERSENQKHDLQLVYRCDDQWQIDSSQNPIVIPEELRNLEIDNKTCVAKDENKFNELMKKFKKIDEEDKNTEFPNDGTVWNRVTLTILSMMVSSSFFAQYDVKTFYTGVVVGMGPVIKSLLLFNTYMAFLYEITHPDPILKLIEAVYMRRHEEDLVGEEECYRMLQEIVRSPELLKSLTGSSLKGSLDPILDRLNKEDQKKLQHYIRLSQKGFDVQSLIEQLETENLGQVRNPKKGQKLLRNSQQ